MNCPETEHWRALLQAQHVAKIIDLHAIERGGGALCQRLVNEDARRAEIVTGHGYSSHPVGWLRKDNSGQRRYRLPAGRAAVIMPRRDFAALLPDSKGC